MTKHVLSEQRAVSVRDLSSEALRHELRQPLFAIQAIAELSAAGIEVEASWSKVLEHLRQIDDLFAREAGLVPGGVARVDLRAPVEAALRLLQARANAFGARLVARLPDGPAWVLADEGAMRQVVVNLVQNALEAIVEAADRRVDVEVLAMGGVHALRVRDRGPGIPADVIERVFEPYVSTKPTDHGVGIGLYLTRTLVERGGGRVRIVSSDEGTLVEVELPDGA